MSSELNRENTRENGGPIHFTSSPAKIDPMTAAAAEQEVAVNMTNGGRAGEEKQDMPKPDEPLAGVLGGSDRSLGQNMMQSTPPASEANPHHYYRLIILRKSRFGHFFLKYLTDLSKQLIF